MNSLFKQYTAAEEFLEHIHQGTPALPREKTFARAKAFLKLLEHPDHAYPIIHVAGTSGKGSTTVAIASILQAAGYRVGVHIQPFVSVATEKMLINGKKISVPDFVALVETLKPTIAQITKRFGAPSYFECWMMAALLYFQQQHVDYVVLETGCGGRFDASNAVTNTLCSVITSIGYDHQHLLGKTLKEIAWNKAGIIRSKGTVFSIKQRPQASRVIADTCRDKHASLITVDDTVNPNHALATTVARWLDIPAPTIMQGLTNIPQLPARFEIVQKKPTIILDGAHNADKLAYLAQQLVRTFPDIQKRRVHLIAALGERKHANTLFKPFLPLVHTIYATQFHNPFRKAQSPDRLTLAFPKTATKTFTDPQAALAAALKQAKATDIILITGSFFLCSNLREHWFSQKKLLT